MSTISATGTMVFGNALGGSTELLMTNDTVGDHVVTVPKRTMTIAGTDDLKEIGVGQTWQNVTASRANNTTYTNTTGKPIFVNVYCGGSTGGNAFLVDGVQIGDISDGDGMSATVGGIVPSGSTYRAQVTVFTAMYELR